MNFSGLLGAPLPGNLAFIIVKRQYQYPVEAKHLWTERNELDCYGSELIRP